MNNFSDFEMSWYFMYLNMPLEETQPYHIIEPPLYFTLKEQGSFRQRFFKPNTPLVFNAKTSVREHSSSQ